MNKKPITKITFDSIDHEQGQTNWERLRAMTDEEAYQNALTDPDNQPLSESDFHSLKVKRIKKH